MNKPKEFVQDWSIIKDFADLKKWISKYMTAGQSDIFNERIAALQEVWEQDPSNKAGMTVQTGSGNGSFDPIDEADPVLEDVNFFSVMFTMDSNRKTYTIFIPYQDEEILDPIACLPENTQEQSLH